MYIVDNSSFMVLGTYYPESFPTIWKKINDLVESGDFLSVKEVQKEIEAGCKFLHIEKWVKNNKAIFKKPTSQELTFVTEMFKEEKNRELIKHKNILNGSPVADPFIIASAKINGAIVITEESYKRGGARIPSICEKYDIDCIKIEQFLILEELIF